MTSTQRNAYKRLFADVRGILNRHDPMGLISARAPETQYELETGTILPRLKETNGPEDVRLVVREEFVQWFGEAPPKLDVVADDVWAAWVRFRNSVAAG